MSLGSIKNFFFCDSGRTNSQSVNLINYALQKNTNSTCFTESNSMVQYLKCIVLWLIVLHMLTLSPLELNLR